MKRKDTTRDELHRALEVLLKHKSSCALMSGSAFLSDNVGSGMRPTTKYAEGGAERQDSVTNGNEQEAKHNEVHQAAAMIAVAFDTKAHTAFEGQSSDRIAKINGLTKAIVLWVENVVILKQLKDEMSADLTAFKKKGLDRKTNHGLGL